MKVLVISPHIDDETLGAGGTILKYISKGYEAFWLNISDIVEEYGYNKEIVEQRNVQKEIVKNMYGFSEFFNIKLKPASLDSYSKSKIISEISHVINKVKPNIVILPYRNDIHSDHKVVFDCSYACTKVFRYPFIKTILAMEIISETDFALSEKAFSPNFFVDISEFLDKKLEIMRIYESELGKHPFPRSEDSIRALATLRGAQSGCKYAEGFRLIKHIE